MADNAARFRLTLPGDADGAGVEMPFVIGVLADLSGHGSARLPALEEREFVPVDRSNINQMCAAAAPRLSLRVSDRLTDSDNQVEVDLSFHQMSDFYPAAVARQIPFLKTLIRDRESLGGSEARLAEIDKRLSRQLLAVMHHPEFRRLESAWLGLAYLVGTLPDEATIKIKVLNVDRKTLAHDLAEADGFDQSILFQKVYDDAYDQSEPFGLLVGDYEFSHSANDVALLQGIAGVAEFALAPFVAGACPKLLGLENFADLIAVRNVAKLFESPEYATWRSFRDSEESRFAALTLPHALARTHYDPITHPVEDFDFDEGANGTDVQQQLWMNAAWVFAGRAISAFARAGWFVKCCGAESGRVNDLAGLAFRSGGRTQKNYTDSTLTELHDRDLAQQGLLALSEVNGAATFLGAASCQKPKLYHDSTITAHAAKGARLNYMLSLARFPQFIKLLAQSKAGSFGSVKTCESWLNEQLNKFVVANPNAGDEAARPLREGRVEIKAVAGSPYHQAILHLRPHFQIDDPDFFIRLGTEIPLPT
jgi:type VI secretion system protein ImpC